MDIYNNVDKTIQQLALANENPSYIQGLKDCYYIFKKYFYASGIYNQHYLENEISKLNHQIEILKYDKSNLEYDIKEQKEIYIRNIGVSRASMVDNIKSLESEVRRLKKMNSDLYKKVFKS
jgi:predicted phage-related endonuclease